MISLLTPDAALGDVGDSFKVSHRHETSWMMEDRPHMNDRTSLTRLCLSFDVCDGFSVNLDLSPFLHCNDSSLDHIQRPGFFTRDECDTMSFQAKSCVSHDSSMFRSTTTSKPFVPSLPTYPDLIAEHIPIRLDASSTDVHRIVHPTSFTLLSDETRIRESGCPVYRRAY